MKYLLAMVFGVTAGLFIATRIELYTEQCMLYWYDKAFHPEFAVDC